MSASDGYLPQIQHFIVLMLENRSFDHLLGFRKTTDPRIEGLKGSESNFPDPLFPDHLPAVAVSRAPSFAMPFDPGHEFDDIQIQLYGPAHPPSNPAAMNGFIASAKKAAQQAKVASDASVVMQCFQPDQIPVLSALADEFAVFNYWHSSLPGPTWPNRFFIHAATSGGLTDSPDTGQIVAGYSFAHGTIYDRLKAAGKTWRIYHDGLPQTAGISSLRGDYVNGFAGNFRDMENFATDVASDSLPDYVFIEPNYDTGHQYQQGNSMHPLNDIRKGETLLKQVYETLRASSYWDKTLLLVTFDEHGGFYDHVSPPPTAPTGDDKRYANPLHPFGFDLLGVRVPAIAISAYTEKGLVIGDVGETSQNVFDHTSWLATVEKRFGLAPLTARDENARTLEVAVNLTSPRLLPTEAPLELPNSLSDSLAAQAKVLWKRIISGNGGQPLSDNQRSQLALALACNIKMNPGQEPLLHTLHNTISTQAQADNYIRAVEQKVSLRRVSARASNDS